MHHDDILIGQRHAWIDARETRVIPLRDFAEEDVREHVRAEAHRLRHIRQVIRCDDRAEHRGNVQDVATDRGDRRIAHRRVGAAEVDRAIRELPDAAARSDRLIVQLHIGMRLVVRQNPSLINDVWERRPSAVEPYLRDERQHSSGHAVHGGRPHRKSRLEVDLRLEQALGMRGCARLEGHAIQVGDEPQIRCHLIRHAADESRLLVVADAGVRIREIDAAE